MDKDVSEHWACGCGQGDLRFNFEDVAVQPNLSGTFELPLAINATKTVRYKSVAH